MKSDMPETPSAPSGKNSLHRLMADATDHLAGVRVDVSRLRHRRRVRLLTGSVAVSGALAVVAAGVLLAPRPPGASGPATGIDRTGPLPGDRTGTGRTPSDGTGITATESDALSASAVTSISVYDADAGNEGEGTEASVITPHGVGWSTDFYCRSRPTSRGGIAKPGTGLLFTLAGPTPIVELDVTIKTPGATMEMWVAQPGLPAPLMIKQGQPPTGFDKVASVSADSTFVAIHPDRPVTTRSFLIWFTSLPQVPAPQDAAGISCASGNQRHYADTIVHVGYRIK